MKTTILMLLFCISTTLVWSQQVTISGIIKDKKTGEALSNIQIYTANKSNIKTSNRYGFFSITANREDKLVNFSGFEYKTQPLDLVNILKDTLINIELSALEYELEEVKISAKKESYINENGNYTLPIEAIKKMPALLSEVDVLKAIQLLPGVQQGTEGTAGIHVRGGSPDQTLVLIDGVPVYNVYHLFGFFSVFNSDAVSEVKFYKNELPARYGGRLSAVVDLLMREGNKKKMVYNVSVSPIAGKFSVEGPIKKDKSSFLFSVRKTWIDLLTSTFQKINSDQSTNYGFYDVNAKVNFELNNRNHIYWSFYSGGDAFANKNADLNGSSKFQYKWGNYTSILRWNKIISQKLFSNTTFSLTNYNYNLQNTLQSKTSNFVSSVTSTIRDWSIKSDFDFIHTSNHITNWGASYTLHRFAPEILQIKSDNSIPQIETKNRIPTLVSDVQGYIQHEWTIQEKLRINAGLHTNFIFVNQKNYSSIQPRLSLIYHLPHDWAMRFGYFKTNQYLHLLTNSSLGLPTDLWVPVTEKIPPQRADQFSVSLMKQLKNWTLSIEAYSKKMNNVIEYTEGASFLNDFSSQWYDKVVIGKGNSKGIEFFAQKNKGKIQGFVSYTLSWTDRVFEGLNFGKPFSYKYDRRHSLATNLSYNFSNKKQISCTFNLLSGSLTSLAVSKYQSAQPPLPTVPVRLAEYDYYLYYFDELGYSTLLKIGWIR